MCCVFRTGLHQINRHLVSGVYSGGDAVEPTNLPGQALLGPAQPYPGCPRLAQPGGS